EVDSHSPSHCEATTCPYLDPLPHAGEGDFEPPRTPRAPSSRLLVLGVLGGEFMIAAARRSRGGNAMQVCGVDPAHVDMVWPLARGFILAAMRRGLDEYYDEGDIRAFCAGGAAQLWLACAEERVEAAVVSRILVYPKRRVCQIPLIGGRRMREWLPAMQAMIEDHARANG